MRNVLFRGKRIDNGEWVQGDLIHRLIWASLLCIIRVSDDGFDHYEEYEVDPETVGEYTGLMDKNGTKVFEGDIVGLDVQSGKTRDVVVWSDGEYNGVAGFRLKSRALYSITSYNRQYFEIVGNVWDNADLLEGKNG